MSVRFSSNSKVFSVREKFLMSVSLLSLGCERGLSHLSKIWDMVGIRYLIPKHSNTCRGFVSLLLTLARDSHSRYWLELSGG